MTTYTLTDQWDAFPQRHLTLAQAGKAILEAEAEAVAQVYDVRDNHDGWWHLTTTSNNRTQDTVIFVRAADEDAAWRAVHEAVALSDAWDRLDLFTDAEYDALHAEA